MFIATFCLSLSMAGCLLVRLSVCLLTLQHVVSPESLWAVQIIHISFLEVERVKIHYI